MKDLTIVVPLYNKKDYILDCLLSIKNSVHNLEWECIVVDDGCDDGSTDIAKDFCNKNHENFTYLQCLRNHGPYPSYARNIGIRMAESEFLMFFDADDMVCDGYPERGVKFMREHPDYSLYSECFYCVHKEDREKRSFEYYGFRPFTGVNGIDYPGFVNVGGGAYTRGIFRTEEVKKHRFKDVVLEDSVFMLDYLYPMKKQMLNTENYSFYYFVCRSQQDVMAYSMLEKDKKLTDREYIYEYVRTQYPEFYQAYIEPNNNYVKH